MKPQTFAEQWAQSLPLCEVLRMLDANREQQESARKQKEKRA